MSSPDSIAESNSAALIRASEQGDTAAEQAILHEHQDSGVQICDTHEALLEAIENNHIDVMRLLVSNGVQIRGSHVNKVACDRMRRRDKKEGTAILDAFFEASNGKWDINETMKSKGLLQVCSYSKDLMAWFLNHGMDPNLHGHTGHCFQSVAGQPFTPIDAAVTTSLSAKESEAGAAKTDILDLIHSFGGKVTKASLFYAISRGGAVEPSVVHWLLDHGADANVEDERTHGLILGYAIDKNAKEMVRILLERGADMHKKDDLGWSPFALAQTTGPERVTMLESHISQEPKSLVVLGGRSSPS